MHQVLPSYIEYMYVRIRHILRLGSSISTNEACFVYINPRLVHTIGYPTAHIITMNVLQILKFPQVHHKDRNTLHISWLLLTDLFVAWLRIEQDGDYFLSVQLFRCLRINREQSIVMIIMKKIIITSDVNSW